MFFLVPAQLGCRQNPESRKTVEMLHRLSLRWNVILKHGPATYMCWVQTTVIATVFCDNHYAASEMHWLHIYTFILQEQGPSGLSLTLMTPKGQKSVALASSSVGLGLEKHWP